jgi:two-component system, sensor histidine kinase YesM
MSEILLCNIFHFNFSLMKYIIKILYPKVMIIIRKRFFSLQYKIFIFSLFLILIPMLAVGFISYIKSSGIVMKKVSISNLNTISQIGSNIEFIMQDVHDTSLYLLQDEQIRTSLNLKSNTDAKDIEKYKIKVQQSLMYLLASKKYIQSIYIQGVNGITVDTKGAFNQLDDEMVKKVIALNGGYIWTTGTLTNYDNTKVKVFSFVRLLKDINNINHSLAILKINVSEQEISNIYKNELISENGDFLIIDDKNSIISRLNNENPVKVSLNEIINDTVHKNKDGYFQINIDGRAYLVTFYNINNTNWRLINLVPLKELLKENIIIQEIMLAAILASFIISAIFAFLFSLHVLSPLKRFRFLMKELEHENFDVSIEVKGNDEISILGKSFNKMSTRLKELMNEIYYVRIKQREAELAALQAQINPHFLYNTLDTIYWMSRIENAFSTSKLIEALSKLFRLSLNSGSEFTTVRNEVDHLNNYIIIQQKRYEGLIDFSINVTEDVIDCKVVKLVLQPMVENAIYHGIEKKGEKGEISVSITRKEDILVYEITDDGNGADEAEVNKLLQNVEEENRGFCLKNVNDRIKLYFGRKFGLEFHSSPGSGTKVVITQPYIRTGDTPLPPESCTSRNVPF